MGPCLRMDPIMVSYNSIPLTLTFTIICCPDSYIILMAKGEPKDLYLKIYDLDFLTILPITMILFKFLYILFCINLFFVNHAYLNMVLDFKFCLCWATNFLWLSNVWVVSTPWLSPQQHTTQKVPRHYKMVHDNGSSSSCKLASLSSFLCLLGK